MLACLAAAISRLPTPASFDSTRARRTSVASPGARSSQRFSLALSRRPELGDRRARGRRAPAARRSPPGRVPAPRQGRCARRRSPLRPGRSAGRPGGRRRASRRAGRSPPGTPRARGAVASNGGSSALRKNRAAQRRRRRGHRPEKKRPATETRRRSFEAEAKSDQHLILTLAPWRSVTSVSTELLSESAWAFAPR